MSQKTKGGINNKLIGRDDNSIRSTYIDLLSFRGISITISRLWKWVSSSYRKDKIISRLQNRLNQSRQKILLLQEEHEREIQKLQDDLGSKLDQIIEANKQIHMAKDIVDRVCKEASEATGIQATGVTDETHANLNRLRQLFSDVKYDSEAREPYTRVGYWMELQKTNMWVEESFHKVIEKDPSLVPDNLKEKFHQDISNYIDWLKRSLLWAKPLRGDLKKLNASKCIPSSIPYREIFKCIRQRKYPSLCPDDVYALHQMIDFLREHLDM